MNEREQEPRTTLRLSNPVGTHGSGTTADADHEPLVFSTRDGLLSGEEIRGEVHTLLSCVSPEPDDDVLVVDGNYGVAAVALARCVPDGDVVVTETSARAAESCRENAARNDVSNLTVELTPAMAGIGTDVAAVGTDVAAVGESQRTAFDLAVFAPKPYDPVDVVNERLADALSLLREGGELYVAGRKNSGIERYAGTLEELAAGSERVTTEEGTHVYRGVRGASCDVPEYVTETEFRATVGDYTCRFLTVPGLFSWESLDDGTAALLRAVDVDDGARVLDCCCGYGAVGAFVGARTDCDLWATDDDVVATTYAETNYERNGVTAETILTGDCLDAVAAETAELDATFDVVLANPPTHAGDGVTKKLFSGIRAVLAPDGYACVVANEIMNYDERLAREFDFETTVVASEGNFDVIRAELP
jgi:16S rRNA (guanine1207-N2)-methyltransferase